MKLTQGLIPIRFYCLPQCGTIEQHMKIFDEHLPYWWPHYDHDTSTSNHANLTKLAEQQGNNYPHPLNLKSLSQNTIYTYDTNIPITFSGPLQTYQNELPHIRNHLHKKIDKFNRLWQQTYLQFNQAGNSNHWQPFITRWNAYSYIRTHVLYQKWIWAPAKRTKVEHCCVFSKFKNK